MNFTTLNHTACSPAGSSVCVSSLNQQVYGPLILLLNCGHCVLVWQLRTALPRARCHREALFCDCSKEYCVILLLVINVSKETVTSIASTVRSHSLLCNCIQLVGSPIEIAHYKAFTRLPCLCMFSKQQLFSMVGHRRHHITCRWLLLLGPFLATDFSMIYQATSREALSYTPLIWGVGACFIQGVIEETMLKQGESKGVLFLTPQLSWKNSR